MISGLKDLVAGVTKSGAAFAESSRYGLHGSIAAILFAIGSIALLLVLVALSLLYGLKTYVLPVLMAMGEMRGFEYGLAGLFCVVVPAGGTAVLAGAAYVAWMFLMAGLDLFKSKPDYFQTEQHQMGLKTLETGTRVVQAKGSPTRLRDEELVQADDDTKRSVDTPHAYEADADGP